MLLIAIFYRESKNSGFNHWIVICKWSFPGLSFHIQDRHQPPGVHGQGQLFKGWLLKINGLGTAYSKVRASLQSTSWLYAYCLPKSFWFTNPKSTWTHICSWWTSFYFFFCLKGKCPTASSGDGDLSLSLKQKWVMTVLALHTQAVVRAPHLLPGGNTFSCEHGVWLSPCPQSAKMWINMISKPF